MPYQSIGEGSSSSKQPLLEVDYNKRKGKERSSAQSYPYISERENEPFITSPTAYGSIIPSTTITTPSSEDDLTIPTSNPSQKTCTYLTIFFTTCFTLILFSLLWFAPTLAERSIDNGMNFSFKKASILNVSNDNVITMHVVGQIELEDSLFNLQKKFSTLFGTIGVQQGDLQVAYIPSLSDSSFSTNSNSMGSIVLPALDLNRVSNVTAFDFTTRFTIDDTDALTKFCQDAVVAKTIMWKVSGPLSINLGWLPWVSNIDLDRTIELEGMNGLKKTDLKSMEFPGPHPLGGLKISGTVGIYNPSSVLSLTLGDMDFGIYLPALTEGGKDLQIAVVQAENADLQGHQMNYFNATGRTLPVSENRQAQEQMETFLTKYLHGNTSTVHVRGNAFGPDDEPEKRHVTPIPIWLRKALENVVLSVPFPGATETDLIQSLEMTNIKIDFSSTGNPLISGDAIAMLKKPQEMQFHMDVTEIKPNVFLFLNEDSLKPFATVKPRKPCPAKTEEGNGLDLPFGTMKVNAHLFRVPFNVLPGGQKDYEEFLNRVFHEKKGKVYMQGTSDAKVDSAFGHLNVRDLEFRGVLETQGLGGLQNPPPKVTSLKIMKGYSDALLAQTELAIYSPSNVAVNLGELNMVLLFNNHVIGNTTIPELKLEPGVINRLTVSAYLYGHNEHVIDFIGQYISNGVVTNNNISLSISGNHPNVTKSEFLKKFLKKLSFQVQIPEFEEEPILADCLMNILSSTVVMSLRNPFEGIEMSITKLNALATYEVYEVGRITANFEDKGEGWTGPLILPPPQCDESKCVGVTVESGKIPIVTKKLGFEAIKKALGGSIIVSVDSEVGVILDQFELKNLQYRQTNITTKVRKGF